VNECSESKKGIRMEKLSNFAMPHLRTRLRFEWPSRGEVLSANRCCFSVREG